MPSLTRVAVSPIFSTTLPYAGLTSTRSTWCQTMGTAFCGEVWHLGTTLKDAPTTYPMDPRLSSWSIPRILSSNSKKTSFPTCTMLTWTTVLSNHSSYGKPYKQQRTRRCELRRPTKRQAKSLLKDGKDLTMVEVLIQFKLARDCCLFDWLKCYWNGLLV